MILAAKLSSRKNATMVKFSLANVKIQALSQVKALKKYLKGKRKVYSFDLISGHTCPHAKDCKSKVEVVDGKRKVLDGPDTEFRCFSASQEAIFTNVYNLRMGNFTALRGMTMEQMVELILLAFPEDAGIVRVHVAGDFFNLAYFMAWVQVATMRPNTLCYAYTKSLPYWVANLETIPANFILTASRGGRRDDLIDAHNLRSVRVVYSEAEAKAFRLDIDHDDSHAADPKRANKPFALLLHGAQPAGSEASAAIKAMKAAGTQFSYSRKPARDKTAWVEAGFES